MFKLFLTADTFSVMKKLRLLTAIFAGTFVYVLVSMIVGRDGMWAFNQLSEQKMILSAHTADIEKTHEELTLEKIALQKDPDVIAAYARKLGYISEGEKLVKVKGIPAYETQIFDPGTVIQPEPVRYVSESVCKCTALVIFFLVYIVLFLYDYNRGLVDFTVRKKKFTVIKGNSLYDL